ncbi:hypothetical protein HAX54_039429, partial [Datura stramonium]|nr:hypothetical protein [Datura stramonium]
EKYRGCNARARIERARGLNRGQDATGVASRTPLPRRERRVAPLLHYRERRAVMKGFWKEDERVGLKKSRSRRLALHYHAYATSSATLVHNNVTRGARRRPSCAMPYVARYQCSAMTNKVRQAYPAAN